MGLDILGIFLVYNNHISLPVASSLNPKSYASVHYRYSLCTFAPYSSVTSLSTDPPNMLVLGLLDPLTQGYLLR